MIELDNKKTIYLIFHHFRLPSESGGLRSFHITNSLLKHNKLKINLEYKLILPTIDTLTGTETELYKSNTLIYQSIPIIYVKCPRFNKNNLIARLFSYLIYSFNSILLLLKLNKPNCILVSTFSLPLLLFIRIYSLINSIPIIIEVRDLFIHGFENLIKRPNFITKTIFYILKKLESFSLNNANTIIPNSPGFIPTLIEEYKLDKSVIKFIPLGIDIYNDFSSNRRINNKLIGKINILEEYKNKGYLLLVYAGSLASVHNPSLIQNFASLIDRKSLKIKILLVGNSLQHKSLSNMNKSIISLGKYSKSEISNILSKCSYGIYISSNKFPYNSILGNKIFDYTKSLIPIVFLSDSVAKRFALAKGIGMELNLNELSSDYVNHLIGDKKNYLKKIKDFNSIYRSDELCNKFSDIVIKSIH